MPSIVLLLGLAVGTQIEGGTVAHVARVVIEAMGIGLIVGLALTWLTTVMLRFTEGVAGSASIGWRSRSSRWRQSALQRRWAAAAFIACLVGGLLLSGLGARHKQELLRGA